MKDILLIFISGVLGYLLRSIQDFINEKRKVVIVVKTFRVYISSLPKGLFKYQFKTTIIIRNSSTMGQPIYDLHFRIRQGKSKYVFMFNVEDPEGNKDEPYKPTPTINVSSKNQEVLQFDWDFKANLQPELFLNNPYNLGFSTAAGSRAQPLKPEITNFIIAH